MMYPIVHANNNATPQCVEKRNGSIDMAEHLTFHHTNLFMFVVHSVLWIAVVDKKILITLTNKISHITIGYDIFWLEERVYGVVVYFIHQEKLYGCEK